jgi:hypothetical protein
MVAQKRVAIYARVSTLDKGQDPEMQLLGLREYAARRAFIVVGEYVDYASGTRVARNTKPCSPRRANGTSMWSWSGATTGLRVPRPPWSMPYKDSTAWASILFPIRVSRTMCAKFPFGGTGPHNHTDLFVLS